MQPETASGLPPERDSVAARKKPAGKQKAPDNRTATGSYDSPHLNFHHRLRTKSNSAVSRGDILYRTEVRSFDR
jgi:hypothetical protein